MGCMVSVGNESDGGKQKRGRVGVKRKSDGTKQRLGTQSANSAGEKKPKKKKDKKKAKPEDPGNEPLPINPLMPFHLDQSETTSSSPEASLLQKNSFSMSKDDDGRTFSVASKRSGLNNSARETSIVSSSTMEKFGVKKFMKRRGSNDASVQETSRRVRLIRTWIDSSDQGDTPAGRLLDPDGVHTTEEMEIRARFLENSGMLEAMHQSENSSSVSPGADLTGAVSPASTHGINSNISSSSFTHGR